MVPKVYEKWFRGQWFLKAFRVRKVMQKSIAKSMTAFVDFVCDLGLKWTWKVAAVFLIEALTVGCKCAWALVTKFRNAFADAAASNATASLVCICQARLYKGAVAPDW